MGESLGHVAALAHIIMLVMWAVCKQAALALTGCCVWRDREWRTACGSLLNSASRAALV
jgi:hypothetical protein